MYNYIINSVELLSFRHVDNKVYKEFLNLFKDGYFSSSTLHIYEDNLHLNIIDEQEILETLTD